MAKRSLLSRCPSYMSFEYILNHLTDFYETGCEHHCISRTLAILQFCTIRNPSVTAVRVFVQYLQALCSKCPSESCVTPHMNGLTEWASANLLREDRDTTPFQKAFFYYFWKFFEH